MQTLLALSGICIAGSLSVHARRFQQRWCVSHYVHHICYVWLTPGWNIFHSPKKLWHRFLFFASSLFFFGRRLIYLQMRSSALTSTFIPVCMWECLKCLFLHEVKLRWTVCVLLLIVLWMVRMVSFCSENVAIEKQFGGILCLILNETDDLHIKKLHLTEVGSFIVIINNPISRSASNYPVIYSILYPWTGRELGKGDTGNSQNFCSLCTIIHCLIRAEHIEATVKDHLSSHSWHIGQRVTWPLSKTLFKVI